MKIILAFLFIICFVKTHAAEFKTDTIVIKSGILNESRTFLIFTPEGFQTTDSVTLLYMPDGEFAEKRYSGLINTLSDKKVIGIGIINTNRNRDLLPAKEPGKFLGFIDTELMPAVEKNVSVTVRILFGHSFAGGFTIYALINKPGLFDKYIASSPTPIMKMIDPGIYKELDAKLVRQTRFYFSYGSHDMKQVIKWCIKLKNSLSGLTLSHIEWKNEIFQGENHNTSGNISLMKGFEF